MNKTCVFFLSLVLSASTLFAQSFDILPYPADLKKTEGEFLFTPRTVISVENEEQRVSAELFADLFQASAGFRPVVSIGSEDARVRMHTDESLAPEAYTLRVTPRHIEILASDNAGFFYALQTLRQMLPAAIEYEHLQTQAKWAVPCGEITDAPRFSYRGLMLDVSRYFIPKETVLKMIDAMSSLKINKLHLHLVDDNGWRLEIKRYPELTAVGAWRVDRRGIPYPARRNPFPGEPATVGGYYTQDDMREIISFAAKRRVEIIPEIEMPAHTVSSLAAYPGLACPVVDDPIGVLPGGGGDHTKIIYCAGNDSVFTFLENVLDEVIALFPSRYIHLGGDEASKYYWERCPLCQARMKAEGIPDEEHLQSYFMARVSRHVQSRGKQVMGWDELAHGIIPDSAIIFGWEANGQRALKAAAQGHRFVMTPARTLYLIRYQGPQWFEPVTYFGNNTLSDVYHYEPVQSHWDERAESLLMGVQASLWTEFCSSPEDVEYLAFPRLAAFADMAWRAKGKQDWDSFLPRLDAFTDRLTARRITYARSMFNLDHLVTSTGNGEVELFITCIRPDVSVRYTLDGSAPTAVSPVFPRSLRLDKGTFVKAASFKEGIQMGQILTLPIRFNKATGCPVGDGGGSDVTLLTNGVRGSDKHSDPEWHGWYDSDFSFTIDLRHRRPLHLITLGTITNYGMAVHQPSEIVVSVSDDNKTFRETARLRQSEDEIFREGTFREDKTLPIGNIPARYIRVEGKNPGVCPENHARPGQKTWVYLDEVIVE